MRDIMFDSEIKKDVYILSTEGSNQSCIFDDIKTLREQLEEFEFSKEEIIIIFKELKDLPYNVNRFFGNGELYNIYIRKSKMTKLQIGSLPEFNGW
jgi:hypothetical protein